MTRTNHLEAIVYLRAEAALRSKRQVFRRHHQRVATTLLLAADLLEMHDATGISLDHWANAENFVYDAMETAGITGVPIEENGA